MEVGAVKQAFNNEVILLKKKLNQAKTQIIHKLTRKAKQLAEKKAPEPLKEKLKRKAQAAVNEVLLIKKIKPKDIAKFIVTHKGELKVFLNRPAVDNDKVCARLLLHKALQDKYKFIRDRFSNVPIKDLFMSRLERRKMKKEAKEQQAKKKKGKNSKVVNSEGDWNVEDVIDKTKSSEKDDNDNELSDEENDGDQLSNEFSDAQSDNDALSDDGNEKSGKKNAADVESEEENDSEEEGESESEQNIENEDHIEEQSNDTESENESIEPVDEVSSHKKLSPEIKKSLEKSPKQQLIQQQATKSESNIKPKAIVKKNPEKKQKEINKSKNFNEKIQKKKLKKDTGPVETNKVVDPFFITASGQNYMSVVEPRGPDEIKAEHKQGNRKLRRAVMFGHVPNIKPRNNNSFSNDNRFSKNGYDKGNKFNDWKEDDRKPFNNKFNDRKRFNDKGNEEKEEKLHPSWEAKKKKSGILPFEGKKIVFD